MPSADTILTGLDCISNRWTALALAWHLYFAALLAGFLLRRQASNRLMGILLTPPLVCVSWLAWVTESPFNGMACGVLALLLAGIIGCSPSKRVALSSAAWVVVGTALCTFAWIYPHFLDAESAFEYLYAAPLGLIPCPTLSMTIGLTLILGGLGLRTWSVTLGLAGLFYGVFGAVYLRVHIDWVLVTGSICLLAPGAVRSFSATIHPGATNESWRS